jgi:hypothetical protein
MNKFKTLLVALLIALAFVTKAQAQQDSSHPKGNPESLNQPSELTNFLKKNPTVADVHWQSDNKIIIIRHKNGKVQTYNLGDLQQRKTFENKYGTPPQAPPPPPHL